MLPREPRQGLLWWAIVALVVASVIGAAIARLAGVQAP